MNGHGVSMSWTQSMWRNITKSISNVCHYFHVYLMRTLPKYVGNLITTLPFWWQIKALLRTAARLSGLASHRGNSVSFLRRNFFICHNHFQNLLDLLTQSFSPHWDLKRTRFKWSKNLIMHKRYERESYNSFSVSVSVNWVCTAICTPFWQTKHDNKRLRLW